MRILFRYSPPFGDSQWIRLHWLHVPRFNVQSACLFLAFFRSRTYWILLYGCVTLRRPFTETQRRGDGEGGAPNDTRFIANYLLASKFKTLAISHLIDTMQLIRLMLCEADALLCAHQIQLILHIHVHQLVAVARRCCSCYDNVPIENKFVDWTADAHSQKLNTHTETHRVRRSVGRRHHDGCNRSRKMRFISIRTKDKPTIILRVCVAWSRL